MLGEAVVHDELMRLWSELAIIRLLGLRTVTDGKTTTSPFVARMGEGRAPKRPPSLIYWGEYALVAESDDLVLLAPDLLVVVAIRGFGIKHIAGPDVVLGDQSGGRHIGRGRLSA